MFKLPSHIIASYIERRKSDIDRLESGLNNNSIEDFHVLGHQLKGTARNYGFPCLEKIAQKMESLPVEKFKEQGSLLITELKNWISQASSEFESLPRRNDSTFFN